MAKRTTSIYFTSLISESDKRPRISPVTQLPPAQLSSSISKDSFLTVLGYLGFDDVNKIRNISPYTSSTINEARLGHFHFGLKHTHTTQCCF